MARTNLAAKTELLYTHGGGRATLHLTPIQQLRRSVASCLLWEQEHYESGQTIADRILTLIPQCDPSAVAALAVEARHEMNLRHVPLLLLAGLTNNFNGKMIGDTIARTIGRADELAELVSIYAKTNKVEPSKVRSIVTKQMKRGLSMAFAKFSAHELAKYNRDSVVKLRDVAFLVHAKAPSKEKGAVLANLVNRSFFPEQTKSSGFPVRATYELDGTPQLETPDTWEVALSGGADKKETFERLLREEKLGYLALLRNLRNMVGAGVDRTLIRTALLARKGAHKVLPFRFLAAAKAEPSLESVIDEAFLAHLQQQPKLPGRTVVIVDVSGSMGARLSMKSDLTRAQAASAVGAILREVCDDVAVYATAGSDWKHTHATAEVPARRGIALIDAIWAMCHPLGGGGIFLNQVMSWVNEREKTYDRVIVITDEQDCSRGTADAPEQANPLGQFNYLINVASAKNGIGYGKWTHIDGFSESCLRFIQEHERMETSNS